MSRYTPDSPTRRFGTLSESSPHRNVAIVVLAFVGILIVGGLVLVLNSRGGNNDNQPQDQAVVSAGTESQGTATLSPNESALADSDSSQTAAPTLPPATPVPPSPIPTVTPTSGSAAVPTEEPVPDVEEPTVPPEEEPEPTNTPDVAEPIDEPLMGDYGTLPESLLPSGGVSSVLQLDYQLGMSLESLPFDATAYLIEWPIYSYDDVLAATDRLGFFGEPQELGVGIYNVESDSGSLFVSPNEIVFTATSFATTSDLPDDATAIDSAATWLTVSGFVGPDMDSGTVAERDEDSGAVVVVFRPTNPQPNLAPNPSATVNVGPEGDVLEARIHWPVDLYGSTYGFKDHLDIWADVASGFGFLEADVTSVFATGVLTGTATVTDYAVSYTLAGSPADSQFLVPLLTFYGTARIDQTGDEIPVTVTVPAVYNQISSAG